MGVLCLSTPAGAGERGWYAGIEAGLDWAGVSGPIISGPACGFLALDPCPQQADATSSAGWAVFGVVGTSLTNYVRLEGEVGYRAADFDGASNISNTTAMLNALFDVPLSADFSLTIGAGIGFDQIDVSRVPGILVLGDNPTELAYQGIAGFTYDLGGGTDLTFKYRYMTSDIGDNVVVTGPNVLFTRDTDCSTVTIGLSFDL